MTTLVDILAVWGAMAVGASIVLVSFGIWCDYTHHRDRQARMREMREQADAKWQEDEQLAELEEMWRA